MPKRVVILVDGQNLYYSIKSLGFIEKDIDWAKLFKFLLEPNDELVRTYWFRPQKLQDGHFTLDNIKHNFASKKHSKYYNDFKNKNFTAIPATVLKSIDDDANVVDAWLKAEKQRFSQIEYNYDQLCLDFNDIEIVKTGIVKINPYTQDYIGEKGVDISLAVKMISLSVEKKCDKIILVSGDYDYVEAIKFVKNNMTKMHIVKIHKGYPPRNKNMSRDLSVLADRVIDLYESEIKTNLLRTV